MTDASVIVERVQRMRRSCIARDEAMYQMRSVREGNWDSVAQGQVGS